MSLETFNIDCKKINDKVLDISYHLDDSFFELKEKSLYSSCEINVSGSVSKIGSQVTCAFKMDGHINTPCDRCLASLKIEVKETPTLHLKMTTESALLEEEGYIDASTQLLNVYDTLYDTICLAMPMRKTCELSLNRSKCKSEPEDINDSSERNNPMWDELKKLKE